MSTEAELVTEIISVLQWAISEHDIVDSELEKDLKILTPVRYTSKQISEARFLLRGETYRLIVQKI